MLSSRPGARRGVCYNKKTAPVALDLPKVVGMSQSDALFTTGEALRRARLTRSLTLEQAAQQVHIKPEYLRALEEGRWDVFASPVQGRGFLRLYAAFLGLDPEPLLAALRRSDAPVPSSPPVTTQPTEADDAPRPPQAKPAAAEDPARPYFAAIAAALREQRERLGLSLEQCEQQTRVRKRYLVALETGRLDDLPSPVQGKGMLAQYARFLHLDPEPLLLQYADGLQARLQARRAQQTRRRPKWPTRPRWLTLPSLPERWLAYGMAVAMALFVLWGGWQVLRLQQTRRPSPTPPSVLEVLHPTPTTSPTPLPGTPVTAVAALPLTTPSPSPTPNPNRAQVGDAPLQVFLLVRQRTFVRVWVDGEERIAERAVPGQTYALGGQARIEVAVANGAAVQVFFNQRDLGLMGLQGEAVRRIFTLQGVQTPTPTPTPLVTPSPTPTITPTATPTPTVQPALP